MVKLGHATLALLIFMVDCVNSGNAIKDTLVAEQYNFSEDEVYLNDIRVMDIAGQSKEEMLLRFGEGCTPLYGYLDMGDSTEIEDMQDIGGYEYPEYGMILYFAKNNIVEAIYCYDEVNINGVVRGMSVTEIQNILGKGEITGTAFYEHYPFLLTYVYEGFGIKFSLFEKNGYANEMEIFFRPT